MPRLLGAVLRTFVRWAHQAFNWVLVLILAAQVALAFFLWDRDYLELPPSVVANLRADAAAKGVDFRFERLRFDLAGRVHLQGVSVGRLHRDERLVSARDVFVQVDRTYLLMGLVRPDPGIFRPKKVWVEDLVLDAPREASPAGRSVTWLRVPFLSADVKHGEWTLNRATVDFGGARMRLSGRIGDPVDIPGRFAGLAGLVDSLANRGKAARPAGAARPAAPPAPGTVDLAKSYQDACRRILALQERLRAIEKPGLDLEFDLAATLPSLRLETRAESVDLTWLGLPADSRARLSGADIVLSARETGDAGHDIAFSLSVCADGFDSAMCTARGMRAESRGLVRMPYVSMDESLALARDLVMHADSVSVSTPQGSRERLDSVELTADIASLFDGFVVADLCLRWRDECYLAHASLDGQRLLRGDWKVDGEVLVRGNVDVPVLWSYVPAAARSEIAKIIAPQGRLRGRALVSLAAGSLEGVEFDVLGTDLAMEPRLPVTELLAQGNFRDAVLNLTRARLFSPEYAVSGEYRQDFRTTGFGMNIEGFVRPHHLNRILSMRWWRQLWGYLRPVGERLPYASVSVDGAWNRWETIRAHVGVYAWDLAYQRVHIDRALVPVRYEDGDVRVGPVPGIVEGHPTELSLQWVYPRYRQPASGVASQFIVGVRTEAPWEVLKRAVGPEMDAVRRLLEKTPDATRVGLDARFVETYGKDGDSFDVRAKVAVKGGGTLVVDDRFDLQSPSFGVHAQSTPASEGRGSGRMRVDVSDVDARFKGGAFKGGFTWTEGAPLSLDFDFDIADAEYGSFMTWAVGQLSGDDPSKVAAKVPGIDSKEGRVDFRAKGSCKPDAASRDDALAGARADARIVLREAKLHRLKALGVLSSVLEKIGVEATTFELDHFSSDLALADGNVKFSGTRVEGPTFKSSGSGDLRLSDRALLFDMDIQLQPFVKDDPGFFDKVMQFPFDVISKVLPVRIHGTLDDVKWSFRHGVRSLIFGQPEMKPEEPRKPDAGGERPGAPGAR